MSLTELNSAAVRRCVDLFNRCTLEWVDTCYAVEVEWTEMPQPSTPAGQRGDRACLRAAAQRLLQLFPDRQMTVRNLVAQTDQVVLDLDWQGTAATALGPQIGRAHV
jgi:ketosteroid isomerase-like protein